MKHSVKKISKIDKSTAFLLIAFVVLLIGFALVFLAKHTFTSDKANTYNGFVIKKGTDNLWHLKAVQGSAEVDVPLHFHPSELENVKVHGDPKWFFILLDNYGLNGAYITFNPVQGSESFSYVALAASEISMNLKQAFNVVPIASCIVKTETGACSERPIVDCSMKDRMTIFIEDVPVNETDVVEETNCIRIKGHGWDLVKAAEKMLYIWYGVI